jgi:hypothetical protein
MKCDEDAGSESCHELFVERIRYFTGRHMTARDFRDADAYHRSFRHLHNRVMHGSGIACGLEVEQHWNPECRRDRVIVRCGMAIDCCGREVVVRRDVVSAQIPWKERPGQEQGKPDESYVLVLCLKYRECLTEKVPVLYSTTACSNPAMEDGRIREGYELEWHWIKIDDLAKYGWDDPRGCAPPHDYDKDAYGKPAQPTADQRCSDEDGKHPCCLELPCPPHHCILLAVIRALQPEEMSGDHQIDQSGRRSLAQAREHLTHICWINWEHGGRVKSNAPRALIVRFDRELFVETQPHHYPGPRGINERTFVVQYGEQAERRQIEDLDFVAYRRPPYLMADRRTAVYEFDKPFRAYRDHVIHVTLRCDFIIDCRKHPVDGNHLAGRLPTGDGIAGGTFESWFRIVDEGDYEKSGSAQAQEQEP